MTTADAHTQPVYAPSAEAFAPREPSTLAIVARRPGTVVSFAVVALYVLLALVTLLPAIGRRASIPLPPLGEKTEYAPPSLEQFPSRLLGTDIQNRSVFYRTLVGTQTALLIAVCTGALSLAIGVTLGVMAGYFGKAVDDVVNWLVATFSAVPWILLVLALGFVLKGVNINVGGLLGTEFVPLPDLAVLILAMALTDWVNVCRLVRAEVLKQRALDYVLAARALGMSQTRVLFRHVLPNTLHLVIITFTLASVGYVQAEVALTFLGINVSPYPSWGRMIDDAKLELLRGVWWQFASATVAIAVLSLALTYLGDALRDALDPKTRTR